MSAPIILGVEGQPITPMAALETIRALIEIADITATDIEDLDELARIRLTIVDLATPIAGALATIDTGIQKHVRLGDTVTVLDGTRTITVKPKRSGGSDHWDHAATIRAVLDAAGGDVDELARCLGKSASWKSTDLKKLDIDVRPLRSTTAAVVGTSVVIEKAVTAS